MVQHASKTVLMPHISLSFAVIIRKPVNRQSRQLNSMIDALTVVCQEVGSDQPCRLVQRVEATRNLDEGSRHDSCVQSGEEQTKP